MRSRSHLLHAPPLPRAPAACALLLPGRLRSRAGLCLASLLRGVWRVPCAASASLSRAHRCSAWLLQVYVVYFKTNKKMIREYPNLLNYTKDMYQQPGVAQSVNMAHIKARPPARRQALGPATHAGTRPALQGGGGGRRLPIPGSFQDRVGRAEPVGAVCAGAAPPEPPEALKRFHEWVGRTRTQCCTAMRQRRSLCRTAARSALLHAGWRRIYYEVK